MGVAARPRLPRVGTRVRSTVGAVIVLGGVAASVAGLERVPAFSMFPVMLALLAFVIGKYVFCPLRWRAISASSHSPVWYVRTFAEAELLGLCTPGHAGADLWRVRRLVERGARRACSFGEVAADRLVGSMGILAFALLSGTALPRPVLLLALVALPALVGAIVLVLRLRPGLRARIPALPGPRRLAAAFGYSVGYQASVLVMLVGVINAVGATVDPLALAGVFAASQCAGIIPGPQGASPKDGALAVGLVALGVPWEAAIGAVSLKAGLAWVPGIVLGGVGFAFARFAPASLAPGSLGTASPVPAGPVPAGPVPAGLMPAGLTPAVVEQGALATVTHPHFPHFPHPAMPHPSLPSLPHVALAGEAAAA